MRKNLSQQQKLEFLRYDIEMQDKSLLALIEHINKSSADICYRIIDILKPELGVTPEFTENIVPQFPPLMGLRYMLECISIANHRNYQKICDKLGVKSSEWPINFDDKQTYDINEELFNG